MTSRRARPYAADALPGQGTRVAGLGNVIAGLRTRERTFPDLPAGNVVPFAPRRASPVPILHADREARPAPVRSNARLRLAAIFAVSVLAHAALISWFGRTPPAVASLGEVSVAVEIVLGGDSAAGAATVPGTSDASATPTPEEAAPPPDVSPPAKTEVSTETAQPDIANPEPVKPEPANPEPQPAARQPASSAPPLPPVRRAERKRSEPVRERPVQRPQTAVGQSATEPAPAAPSNGVGIGRSDASADYRSLVSAHLIRHKQFPAEAIARGLRGSAMVVFGIDGTGHVVSLELGRSSGIAAFDRESEDMVRRASPFPPPPSGRPMTFTVPIDFSLR